MSFTFMIVRSYTHQEKKHVSSFEFQRPPAGRHCDRLGHGKAGGSGEWTTEEACVSGFDHFPDLGTVKKGHQVLARLLDPEQAMLHDESERCVGKVSRPASEMTK